MTTMTTNDDKIKEINKLIDDKYEVLGFIEKHKKAASKCIMNCKIHGNGNDWGII